MPGIIQSSTASGGAPSLSRMRKASRPSAADTTSIAPFEKKCLKHAPGNGIVLGKQNGNLGCLSVTHSSFSKEHACAEDIGSRHALQRERLQLRQQPRDFLLEQAEMFAAHSPDCRIALLARAQEPPQRRRLLRYSRTSPSSCVRAAPAVRRHWRPARREFPASLSGILRRTTGRVPPAARDHLPRAPTQP